jgi:hypothetical protein
MTLNFLIVQGRKLKLPATRCGESPIVKENVCFLFSLPPPQAVGNALAVQFKVSNHMKGISLVEAYTKREERGK